MRRVRFAGPEKVKCGCGAWGLVATTLMAGAASAAEPAAALSIGSFRVGMTLEEARAAAPQLAWENVKGLGAHWQDGLRAPDAVQLNGQVHELTILRGWYGGYLLRAQRIGEVSGPSACRALIEGFIADLEQRYGAFSAKEMKYKDESPLFTGGKPARTDTLQAGHSSSYTWHVTAAYSEAAAVNHDARGELEAHGQFFVSGTSAASSTCRTSFSIEIKPSPPEKEEIPVANLTPLVVPSIAVLHDTALGLEIPAAGLTVIARCRVHRDRGTVGGCQSDDKLPPGFSSAVVLRSAHLAFATPALSPGNPVPLYSRITFRFEPRQRLAIDAPANLLDASAVSWSNEFDGLPAVKSINTSTKVEYDTATVSAACQIQADGSLVCVDFKVARPENQPADERLDARFVYTAKDQWLSRRAAKSLSRGGPSAGRWVTLQQQVSLRRIKRT